MIFSSREQQILESIREVFTQEKVFLGGRRVVLFGSRASGTTRPRSDFDIGIDGAGPLDAVSFTRIADRLDRIDTLYRIDLVDMQTTSERFRAHALNHARVLYE